MNPKKLLPMLKRSGFGLVTVPVVPLPSPNRYVRRVDRSVSETDLVRRVDTIKKTP